MTPDAQTGREAVQKPFEQFWSLLDEQLLLPFELLEAFIRMRDLVFGSEASHDPVAAALTMDLCCTVWVTGLLHDLKNALDGLSPPKANAALTFLQTANSTSESLDCLVGRVLKAFSDVDHEVEIESLEPRYCAEGQQELLKLLAATALYSFGDQQLLLGELRLMKMRIDQLVRMLIAQRHFRTKFGSDAANAEEWLDNDCAEGTGASLEGDEEDAPDVLHLERDLVRRIRHGLVDQSKLDRISLSIAELATYFTWGLDPSPALRKSAERLAESILQVQGLRGITRKCMTDALDLFAVLGSTRKPAGRRVMSQSAAQKQVKTTAALLKRYLPIKVELFSEQEELLSAFHREMHRERLRSTQSTAPDA